MLVLGIESSSMVASVAIISDEKIICEYTINNKKTHSQTILPMIDEMIKMSEIDKKDIDAIAVSGGPGSFTGLRIGGALAKGLGFALNIPLIHVKTLEGMAFQLYGTKELIVPIMDAKRNQVYTGIYENENEFKVIKEQTPQDIEELIQELNQTGRKVTFLGDGIFCYKDIIEEKCKVEYTFAPSHCNMPRAASVAALGLKMYNEDNYQNASEFLPDYLRVSQAERERNERLKHGNN